MHAHPETRSAPRRGVIPVVVFALVALASLAGFAVARRVANANPANAQQVVAAERAAAISERLRADDSLLSAAAQALGGQPRTRGDLASLSGPDGSETIGVAAGGAGPRAFHALLRGNGDSLDGIDVSAPAAWGLALDLARDSGTTVAAVAARPDGTPTVLEAKALYGSAQPAAATARRNALLGYVLLLTPANVLAGTANEGADARYWSVRLLQGSTVVSGSGPAFRASSASSAPVNANGADWTVEVRTTRRESGAPWLVLVAGLLLAAIAGRLTATTESGNALLAREAVDRANELALIARIGPLLQGSLELAELLPIFVVEVSEQLDLRSAAIGLVGDLGQMDLVFSVGGDGATLPDEVSAASTVPSSVPPGGSIVTPLVRGGRVIGALSAVTASGLEPSQIDALRAVCDLLAAALGNAMLYQDEQDMVARLRDLDRLKSTFLGSVSHELRTAVVAIEGFAGLLADQGDRLDDSQRRDFLERIRRNARSLGLLIEDLLDSARLERPGTSLSLQPVDLTDLVPKVVDQMSSILGNRAVSIAVEPAVVAMADPASVERILVNLLSNAAKYTPEGTEIDVSLESRDTSAVLCVADRGPGISAVDRERIFDRFYRIDNEAARVSRGVGIGLALVRQLTDLLHGTIVADETPGGGARFTLDIPLAADRARPAPPLVTVPSRRHTDVASS